MPATVTGRMRDLLENAASQGKQEKILNGLDFPMWKDAQWDRHAYATDMVAWEYVLGRPYCGQATSSYPLGHVRWGLAGTAHTVTMLHIDSDGFSTFGQVMCGKKLWAIYRPSPDCPISDIKAFLNSDSFQLERITPKSQFGLEAVVLRPGDMLYAFFLSFFHYFLIFA
jgi:hypothetical protein